jgi:ABC-type antimicrobial peptide transport system permease subunit
VNTRTLVARGLRHYWRTHLGVVLGCAAGTAVLVGALAIGDSVRESLARTARARTGSVALALTAPDRLFRTVLACKIAADLHAPAAPALQLSGTLATDDGSVRVPEVQVLGVDAAFWQLDGAARMEALPPRGGVVLNRRAAARLGVGVCATVLLRVEKPGRLPGDAPFSGDQAGSIARRVTVEAFADDADFGRFSLTSAQVSPVTAFLNCGWLEAEIGLSAGETGFAGGAANLLLVGGDGAGGPSAEQADAAFARHWELADAGLEVAAIPERGVFELRSRRVFLDEPVAAAAAKASPDAVGVLTYLVNELRLGDRATPYSMVTAIGPLGANAASPALPQGVLPGDMRDDEIVLNAWLAEDLAAKPGDTVHLRYFVLGPTGGLSETSSALRVRSVVPLEGAAADPTLMPDFPGLADVENCRDWKPGIPIDTRRIRPQDEAYWKAHRGTPKAFVTLAAGQKMWGNQFGSLTAVRVPAAGRTQEQVASALRRELRPADLGLFFQPVGGGAPEPTTDFGQLFLGFSFFLVVAAMLLVGLLFAFGVEQRAAELGTLLALGIPRRRVVRLMLLEGGALALIGSAAGCALGTLYTRAMLHGLATVWSDAVGSARIDYHAAWATLGAGAAAGLVIALGTIWLSVRRLVRRPARDLLAFGAGVEASAAKRVRWRGRVSLAIGVAGAAGAVVLAALGAARQIDLVAAFMTAGTLVLVAGLAFARTLLVALGRTSGRARLTLRGLGLRNITRRRGRSLATVALLAVGAFLVVAIGANRQDPAAGAASREAGTGGFALFGTSSMPVREDLNTERGRQAFGLPRAPLEGVAVVPLRVRQGDDASCLNLSRARRPALVGVDPRAFAERGAFTFVRTIRPPAAGASPWTLLEAPLEDGAVPAVGDDTMITWSLGKSVGDTLDYTDDRGRPMRVRIVGALANSVLQGNLVIAERDFVARFPSEGGYRMFLIDAPADRAEAASKALSRGLEDVGLALVPAAERLAAFAAVENTYLAIFQVLGGLGLVLGSVGLGLVVLRNVLERRGELALLRAVGFSRGEVRWLVLSEHWGLLAMGLVCGVAAAGVAVVPALASPRSPVPWASLALALGAVVASGAIWTFAAAVAALRGPLLGALRNE